MNKKDRVALTREELLRIVERVLDEVLEQRNDSIRQEEGRRLELDLLKPYIIKKSRPSSRRRKEKIMSKAYTGF